MTTEIITTIVFILGVILVLVNEESSNNVGKLILGVFATFFILFIWLDKELQLTTIKDYMNGKTKIEIQYKQTEVLRGGVKDTIFIPIDTILVKSK